MLVLHELVNNTHFSLQKIAEELGYSTRHVARLIQQEYGRSLGDIHLNFRLDGAKQLLQQKPELPMPEIAVCAGFADVNALYRAFRKVEHCTPAQYRARKE